MCKLLASTSLLTFIFLSNPAFAAESAPPTSRDHGHDMEEIFVSASPHAKSRLDVLQGNSLLSAEELSKRMEATIGETLSGIPGISSSFFGPGASRPIIRGLGGDRVRVLINGIGSIDASSVSPDHAVAGDPLTAERIEILRGASTLLYGSNAAGGVVNIIDSRIPTEIPDNTASGRARLSYGSNAEDFSAGGSLNIAVEKKIVLHLDGYRRKSSNYDIPGFAESAQFRALEEAEAGGEEHEEHEEEEQFGTVENSDIHNKGGAVGVSFIGENALLGMSFNINDSNYGIPGGHSHEEEHEEEHEGEEHEEHEEEVVRIDLNQKRFDLKGNLTQDFLIFAESRLRFGYADYEHKELEGPEIGTVFTNTGWEGRLEFIQQEMGNLHGSMGLQLRHRDFEAVGAEAFVPPTSTFQWGIFMVEEIELDRLTLELGGRYDHQKTENQTLNITRNFSSFSFSAGAAYHPAPDSLIGLSLSRTERSPTAEELFSNGPHLATNAFEVGNLALKKERANNIELTFKKYADNFNASLNLYYTWYGDFIFEQRGASEQDGLTVFEFHQQDARFYGAEIDIQYDFMRGDDYVLSAEISGDIVRAKFANDQGNVPRIPAKSLTLGLDYQSDYIEGHTEVRFVGAQNNIAAGEITTDGYTTLNASAAWHPFGEERDLNLRLQVQNITNKDRRQHASFLKDLIPMPGRNFKLSLNYGF